MRKTVVLLSLLCLLALAGPARAATVTAFDNFGPGDSHMWSGVWFGTLSGGWPSYVSYTDDAAGQFTATATGTLSELSLGMAYSVGSDIVTLTLLSDVGGTVGSTLWSRTYNGILGSYNTYITGIGGPELTAGTTYWLMASAADKDSRHTWYGVDGNPDGNRMGRREWGSWSYIDPTWELAMRVGVDAPAAAPVPEPSTALLLCGGLATAGLFSRKRSRR